MTPTVKIPGWGFVLAPATRASPDGEHQALITTETHEAPFWAGLEEVQRHQGRIIYDVLNQQTTIAQEAHDDTSG